MFMVGFLGSRFLEMRLEGFALQTQLAHVFSHWVVIFFQLGNLPLRECFVPTRMYSNSFFENAIWPITVVGFLSLLLVSDFVFFHACWYATVILSDLNIEFRCGLWLTAVGSKKVMGWWLMGAAKFQMSLYCNISAMPTHPHFSWF